MVLVILFETSIGIGMPMLSKSNVNNRNLSFHHSGIGLFNKAMKSYKTNFPIKLHCLNVEVIHTNYFTRHVLHKYIVTVTQAVHPCPLNVSVKVCFQVCY